MPWPNAYGQSCPFPDSVAVADTLDPSGYFPLQVGNVWEYITQDSGFFAGASRTEISTDTLIAELQFFKLKRTFFIEEPIHSSILIPQPGAPLYRTFVDEKLVAWAPEVGLVTLEMGFDKPFNSCFVDPHSPPDLGVIAVAGGYGGSFSIMEGDTSRTITVPALKSIGTIHSGAEYAHGIGAIGGGAEVTVVTELVFARIDGNEMGTRLDSLLNIQVAIEDVPDVFPGSIQLQTYPNPLHNSTTLAFTLDQPGAVILRIVDVLGRTVAQPLARTFFSAGSHELVWDAEGLSSGVYFAHLVVDQRHQVVTKLLVVR